MHCDANHLLCLWATLDSELSVCKQIDFCFTISVPHLLRPCKFANPWAQDCMSPIWLSSCIWPIPGQLLRQKMSIGQLAQLAHRTAWWLFYINHHYGGTKKPLKLHQGLSLYAKQLCKAPLSSALHRSVVLLPAVLHSNTVKALTLLFPRT